MKRTRFVALAAVCLSLFIQTAAAADDINRLFHSNLEQDTACPSGLRRQPQNATELKSCVTQLAGKVRVAPNVPPARSRTATENARVLLDENTQLLQYYAAYIVAKESTQLAGVDDEDRRSIDDIGDVLHRELQDRGLEETAVVAGELRAGSALTNPGTINKSSVADTNTGSEAEPLAHIAWTTTHSGSMDKSHGTDADFSGVLGLQPAMTIVKGNTTGTLDPKYQQALVIGANIDVNNFTGRHEIGGSIRGGFVRLGQLSQIVEKNGTSELAIPAGKDDRVAPYFEAAFRFNLYDRPMPVVHLTHGELSPRLWTEAAFRHDARFADIPELSSNKGALMWRLMVDGIKIHDTRTAPVGNNTFTASFGFEYQKGLSGLPDGFSFLISGDVDLLKALTGGNGPTP